MNPPRSFNIISKDNGVGLSRNIAILSDVLRGAGFSVAVTPLPRRRAQPVERALWHVNSARRRIDRIMSRWRRPLPRYDVNVFLETVAPRWLSQARVNCLVPNQECFNSRWRRFLPEFDLVLCKTRHAQARFDALGCKTEFISFSSADRFDGSCRKDYGAFFHLAGQNPRKGTLCLAEAWRRHADWPRLTIIQHPRLPVPVSAANVDYIARYMPDAELRSYQNTQGVHLAPSEAEGFGHSINEAMSCRALTVTTDGPPMNEHVTPTRGMLVPYNRTRPECLGTSFYVTPDGVERTVEQILAMPLAARKQRGEAARSWYLENHDFFRRRMAEVAKNL